VPHLRQLMLDELQRRNYSQSTARSFLAVGACNPEFPLSATIRDEGNLRSIWRELGLWLRRVEGAMLTDDAECSRFTFRMLERRAESA